MTARPLWTDTEVARALGAAAVRRAFAATGVSIDSRTLSAGDLFVAIRGPRHDGHAFVADALAKGAAAAIVEEVPDGADQQRLIRVASAEDALNRLAAQARERSAARVVAVTGSVGKTGTKEALRLVLGRQGRVGASQGNLNNRWGVPLSLARLPSDADFAVFEIGMNHAGEITPLSNLVRPNAAIVTAIEPVHIEFFETLDQIADAKAEIFAGLIAGGVAVLCRDGPYFERLAAAAARAGAGQTLSFGITPGAAVRLLAAEPGRAGTAVEVDVQGERIAYRLRVAGRHWVVNSLGVLACVLAIGADVRAAAEALVDLEAPKGRGARSTCAVRGGSIELIDDSYNASPAAMRAALAVLAESVPAPGGRRIAVLGDMLELGRHAALLHTGLASAVEDSGCDLLFTAGREMALLSAAVPARLRGGHAATSAKLVETVLAALRAGDVVLVKGSAGSRMGAIVEALQSGAAARAGCKTVNGE